jgi:predicted amidohydrolase
MQDLKVALVQTKQFWENKLLNFEHFDMHLNSISEEEVDLILLPEMFNTSFSMNVHQLAESMTGKSINWLINWAKRLNCSIGASLIIEENNCFYNRFVIVDQQGIQAKYDKRHLFRMANEDQAFTAGTEKIILNLKGWNLLLQTCYDLRFPVFTRNYSIDGALAYDAILYVANWPAKRAMVWKCLLQARAIENQVFVLGVNRVGEDGNQITYAGDSAIINPWGNKLQIAQENQETILFGCLKHDDILEIRSKFPAFLDADPLV